MNKKKGLFITLEGNEGCGKSTQIKKLQAYLKKRGFRIFLTREPGGTAIGDQIRRILLDPKNKSMRPDCEVFLYMASRAELVREAIRPRLRRGFVVLCDRWLDATIAYQGAAGGVDIKWIKKAGERATGGLEPDLTLYLDLDVAVGLLRAKKHKKADRVERKKLSYHKKVRQGFLRIEKNEPERFKRLIIRPRDNEETVHQKIKGLVDHVIGRS